MSARSPYDLEWLLRPCSVDTFRRDLWQQRAALITAANGPDLATLFSSYELEELIEVAQPAPPSIRLAARGRDPVAIPRAKSGRLDMDEIRRRFLDGYTIIVNNVHLFHPKLNSLVQGIQRQTSFPVEANCYFTPPDSQGFHAHYDTHDVFVAQIEGEKEWHLYGGESACPLNEMVDGDPFQRDDLGNYDVAVLRPGSVLYIPRGWVHEAVTRESSSSLHITLGVHAPTGRELLHAAIDAMCRADPMFRQALPLGFLGVERDPARIASIFDDLIEALAACRPVEVATSLLEDDLIRRHSSTGHCRLAVLSESLSRLDTRSRVERVPHIQARVIPCGDAVVLQFLDRLVEVPSSYGPALQFLSDWRGEMVVGALPGLDDDAKVALTKQLLRDGLLRLADTGWQGDRSCQAGADEDRFSPALAASQS